MLIDLACNFDKNNKQELISTSAKLLEYENPCGAYLVSQ